MREREARRVRKVYRSSLARLLRVSVVDIMMHEEVSFSPYSFLVMNSILYETPFVFKNCLLLTCRCRCLEFQQLLHLEPVAAKEGQSFV